MVVSSAVCIGQVRLAESVEIDDRSARSRGRQYLADDTVTQNCKGGPKSQRRTFGSREVSLKLHRRRDRGR